MKRLIIFCTVLFTAVACEREAPPAASIEDFDLAVHCGTVIDGLSDAPSTDRIIVMRDERIAAILPGNDVSIPTDQVLDLTDHTCLPGLIDMHVHVDGYPEDSGDFTIHLKRSRDDKLTIAAEISEIILRSGFTTARNVGTYYAWLARDIRTMIDRGDIPGPRLRVAGPYLTIPHGGGDMYIPGVPDEEIPAVFRMGVARGADDFAARAQANVDGGADFLKVIASGAVFGYGGVPGAPEMTFDELKAVVDVAKAAGIKVTAHAHSAESIKDAILAGVDSIEHASLGDDESIALALEHDIAFSMDVYNGTYTEEVGESLGYAEEFMRKNEETTEAQREVFRKALDAGVTLMFGTDLGVLPHDLGARQFAEMVKQGMAPMHAIKSATSIAADHMGLSADVGALEVGRYGDLIAVTGDPLADITLLQDIKVVIKGGDIVRQ